MSQPTLTMPTRLRALGMGAMAALALTACGGSGGEASLSSTTTAASTSASVAASSSDGAESGSGSASAGATESADDSGSASGSGTAVAGEESGAYVPASSEGPAQNVPEPQMPAAMMEQTPEGAEAAVRYWWEAMYYLQQTNDSGPLETVASDSCDLCHAHINTIATLYEAGKWHSGTQPTVQKVVPDESDPTVVTALITQEAGRAYNADGSIDPKTDFPRRSDRPWEFTLVYDDKARNWLVDSARFTGAPS